MKIDFSIDDSAIKKDLAKQIEIESKNSVRRAVNEFFKDSSEHKLTTDGVFEFIKVKGPGTVEIEDMVIKKYADPEFNKKLNTFFEENWQRIFEEGMTKALHHKANGVVFSKTKEMK